MSAGEVIQGETYDDEDVTPERAGRRVGRSAELQQALLKPA